MRFSASNNPQNHIYTKIAYSPHRQICDELPQYVTADQQEISKNIKQARYRMQGHACPNPRQNFTADVHIIWARVFKCSALFSRVRWAYNTAL